jgi:hypothetical protein
MTLYSGLTTGSSSNLATLLPDLALSSLIPIIRMPSFLAHYCVSAIVSEVGIIILLLCVQVTFEFRLALLKSSRVQSSICNKATFRISDTVIDHSAQYLTVLCSR